MKTWICNTLCNFYAPLLGTARLYAYARRQGHDVTLKDFNQDAYFTLLSRDYLAPLLDRLKNNVDAMFRTRFLRRDLGSLLLESSHHAVKQLVAEGLLRDSAWGGRLEKAGLAGPALSLVGTQLKPENLVFALLSEKDYVLDAIERSRRIMDERFFDLPVEEFLGHFCTLLAGKAIIDTACFPAQLDFGLGFHGTAFLPRVPDIVESVTSEKLNFLLPYYRNKVLPMLEQEQPDVVGISMTCVYELVPAFTLAHMVKQARPDTHVVLGGILTTQLSDRIARNPALWEMFDSLVLGPGEVAFDELLGRLDTKHDLSGVPNLLYRENGGVRRSEVSHEFDINEAVTPEFVGVRPKSGLPLETASGCYWGRCIFCYYPQTGSAEHASGHGHTRMRRMELVLEDIHKLKEAYDPLVIGFTDSSMHPRRLEQVIEDNVRSARPIKFSALFRMEKEFRSREFCGKLADGGFLGGYVGLESGSQRVNDIINKGITIADTGEVIKNFHEAGMLLHVFSIIGTPGETKEDARETYEFFKRWHRYLEMDWVIYYLYLLEDSPIAQRADELAVKYTPLPDEYLVQATRYQTSQGLAQEEAAGLAISFSEKLKKYSHPLTRVMDIESMAMFLLAQKAAGVSPGKIRKKHFKPIGLK